MLDWIAKNLRASVAGVFCWLPTVLLSAVQAQPPPVSASFDPSDVYFQGYLATRSAERAMASEDYIAAAEQLERAAKLFATVKQFYPEWKPEMVNGRAERTTEALTQARAKADEQLRRNRSVVAELEGGVKAAATDPAIPNSSLTARPAILEVDPLVQRRLDTAQAEVERLRRLAASQTRDLRQQGHLTGYNEALRSQLKAAETQLANLKSQLSAAPVESEMKALNQRIESLEQEREAMALALTQSRGSHTEALAKIATLEADLKVMAQKHADLDRDLKAERKVANEVVTGQRRQYEALEKKLEAKNQELADAHKQISSLVVELKESQEAFAQLRTERDSLVQERDQMAALLKLNEAGRIQDLIEQNMALAKNLREANEKVDRLSRESNADKDAITRSLRDLAIAKSQINRLHQDKREQEKRIAELEQRLKQEESALASGNVAADPAEIEVLRDIIRRQLRVQERRRQARDLLVEAVKELGTRDERLAQAIELFNGEEIALSPEEQKLIDNKQVDGEFISPFARDRAAVGEATAELNRDIVVFERTAEKAFLAGRYMPTRELYQMILDQHPGHTPSLCKLGVVHLRLKETEAAADVFRRAVELDANNPYAFRMLAFSLMSLGDIPAAEQAAARSVELAPNDAKSQLLFGTLCYRLNRTSEAESHFKAAITADPQLSEPYYNLALLCVREGRLDEARSNYEQALELGALPDPALQDALSKS